MEHDGKCADPGCVAFKFDTDAALREGWDVVEEQLYCPLHRETAARQAFIAAEDRRVRLRIEELRSRRNKEHAKTWLTADEYRKWDEFQSDLVNFHQNNGKLAPAVLRTLDAKKWRDQYKKTGRIDVEAESVALFKAEARAAETRKWLMGRVE